MATLCLGVVDVAYTDGDKSTTTGDVAEYIEDEFHVMRTFLEMYEDQIGEWLVDAISGDIESIAQGRPVTIASKLLDTNLAGQPISGTSINGKIEDAFRNYLDLREWKRASGVAVAAADAGVNHRKKRAYVNTNPARAEFVDTGLYQAAFRAWIE